MRRPILASEYKKFFQNKGYISFENLIPSDEIQSLWDKILKRHEELPEASHENISRTIPEVLKIAYKLGKIVAELLDRKPIRFLYDMFIEDLNLIRPIQDREIALLLSRSGKGIFSTHSSHFHEGREENYLLILFTANYVNTPIIYNN
ncbi:MAG: DUF5070 domain-containing protein [Chlamydiales bacterium]